MNKQLHHHILPPVLFFFSVVSVLLFWFLAPLGAPVPWPVNLFGLVFVLLGLYLLLRGSSLFKSLETNIKPFKKPDKLVTEGPYQYSRNPMYLGFVALLFGLCFLLGAASPFIMVLFFFLVVNLWYIPHEERMCEEEFGDDYREYMQKVRRWV